MFYRNNILLNKMFSINNTNCNYLFFLNNNKKEIYRLIRSKSKNFFNNRSAVRIANSVRDTKSALLSVSALRTLRPT